MKATDEWLYLCASHKNPQECSAIDYMIHSLDHATAIIHNTKNFNSRVSIPPASTKLLLSIVRRLYRLFTHTYFHHKEIFMEFENEMHLCARFTEFARRFKMMSNDLFIIPEEALQIWFNSLYIKTKTLSILIFLTLIHWIQRALLPLYNKLDGMLLFTSLKSLSYSCESLSVGYSFLSSGSLSSSNFWYAAFLRFSGCLSGCYLSVTVSFGYIISLGYVYSTS